MIKILAACGAGVNSSHQIKSALEEELSNRGYDVQCDAVMVKDVNEDLIKGYDIFTPIAATDLGFDPGIPVVEAGPILFRIPAMSAPVYDNIEVAIKRTRLKLISSSIFFVSDSYVEIADILNFVKYKIINREDLL